MSSSSGKERVGLTAFEAAVALAKCCVGSGVLALPSAVQRGGLVFSPLALIGMASWNYVAVDMMVVCKQIVASRKLPPGVNSAYSRIAYSAYGWVGVRIADSAFIITLLGVSVTYLITASAMLQDVIGLSDSRAALTWMIGLCLYPLACAEDIQKLAGVNLVALFAIIAGVLVLFWFGIDIYGEDMIKDNWENATYFPETVGDFTYYLGVAAFCFGMCTLVFPVEEAMQDKRDLNKAVWWALAFVVTIYSTVGDGLYSLYKYDDRGVMGNVLQNLPLDSAPAFAVRLSIVGVCCLSFPFIFLPPAQMIEKYFFSTEEDAHTATPDRADYTPVPSSTTPATAAVPADQEEDMEPPTHFYVVRGGLLALCTLLATVVPCFGAVVSLLGAFTVTALTFVLPPLCHMEIMKQQFNEHPQRSDAEKETLRKTVVWDVTAVAAGVVLCIIGTVITFQAVLDEIEGGNC
jgi:amino acid permease